MGVHLGIIPDGNRRYADENNRTLEQQYLESYEKVKDIIQTWSEEDDMGITQLTFYVCSADNLTKRPYIEISLIYKMLDRLVFDYLDRINENKLVKLEVIGNTKLLPDNTRKGLDRIRRKTKKNEKYILRLAIGYDPREEISKAYRKCERQKLDLNPENVKKYLIPDIDLVVRTGKEKRLSGFFPWQTIYSELFFLDIYWPEFDKDLLRAIVQEFYNRKRRFGK